MEDYSWMKPGVPALIIGAKYHPELIGKTTTIQTVPFLEKENEGKEGSYVRIEKMKTNDGSMVYLSECRFLMKLDNPDDFEEVVEGIKLDTPELAS